jgi:hypothetical protein
LGGPTTGVCISGIASPTYTTAVVAGATNYTWVAPLGTSIASGQGTTAVTLNVSNTFTTGTISVTASNACGNSAAKTLAIRSTPIAPTTLGGPTTGVCISGIASPTYTTAVVAGATNYTWVAPLGTSIASGQGTTAVTLNVSNTFTTGTISVTANNACGSSAAKTLAIRSTLIAPAAISGQATGVCASSISYTATAVAGATSYMWATPTNTSIVSGQGSNVITLSFNPSFVSGTLTVTAVNACGSGLPKTLALTAKPGTPATLSGPTNSCGLTVATYSCTAVLGASNYTWTLPAGMTITSGQGTTSVNVAISSSVAGTVKVIASNTCGAGTAKSLAVGSCASPIINASEEETTALKITIYPNPTSGIVQLATTIQSDYSIRVYSIVGRLVYESQNQTNPTAEVDLSTEENGLYFIQLLDNNKQSIYYGKILKQ